MGYKLDDLEIGLDPNGQHRDYQSDCIFAGDEIKSELLSLLGAGTKAIRGVSNVGDGRYIATVRDPDGNAIGLKQDP